MGTERKIEIKNISGTPFRTAILMEMDMVFVNNDEKHQHYAWADPALTIDLEGRHRCIWTKK